MDGLPYSPGLAIPPNPYLRVCLRHKHDNSHPVYEQSFYPTEASIPVSGVVETARLVDMLHRRVYITHMRQAEAMNPAETLIIDAGSELAFTIPAATKPTYHERAVARVCAETKGYDSKDCLRQLEN